MDNKNTGEAFVDYLNDLTDKVQDYTAKKLEKIEEKAKKVIEDTKAVPESQARTINNMVNGKHSELRSTTDTILFG